MGRGVTGEIWCVVYDITQRENIMCVYVRQAEPDTRSYSIQLTLKCRQGLLPVVGQARRSQ